MFQDTHKPDDLSAPASLPEPPPAVGKAPAAGQAPVSGQIVPEERMRLRPGGNLPPQTGPMMPSLPAEKGR
jgi:hypothetical protein